MPTQPSTRLSLLLENAQQRFAAACLLAITGAGRVASSRNLLRLRINGLATMTLDSKFNTKVLVIGARL